MPLVTVDGLEEEAYDYEGYLQHVSMDTRGSACGLCLEAASCVVCQR